MKGAVKTMVRFGIIGIGNMGTTHCKNFLAGKVNNGTLTAICDTSAQRKKFAEENFKEVKFFDTPEELLDSGLIDVVVIATPHYDHTKLAIAAFERGLNVLVEKPAGVYTKQVLEMNEAAKKSGKLFGIMYQVRTYPVYQRLRKLIQDGELGKIHRASWTITDWYRPQAYHDSSTWRSTWRTEGGGALINQNPHNIDMWQWLFGVPSKIMSHVGFGKYYDIEVEDDVTVFMQYENGMTGTYITSTGEAPGTNRLEIACDRGRVVVENNKIFFDRTVVPVSEFNKTNTAPFGTPESWKIEVPFRDYSFSPHVEIFNNYVRALETGSELLAPGEDGIKGLTISNAIHYSAWTDGWADVDNFPHDEFYNLLQEKIANSTVVKEERESVAADMEASFNG